MKKKLLSLFVFILLTNTNVLSQCNNAIDLPCATNNMDGTTVGSTSTSSGTGCTMGSNGTWYTFVGNGDQTTITVDASFDAEIGVASGSCGSLTNVGCQDGGNPETYSFVTTNGVTYYVYVAHWSGGSTTTGDFTISRSCTTVTPPSNDEPCNAIAAPVNADLNCGSVASGTLAFASNSNVATTCSGTPNDDVWYRFTATSTVHHINLNNISGSPTDLYHAVYNGTCGALSLITGTCSDPNSSIVGGLTIGNTYYVQVYSWSSITGATTSFDICIGTPPPPPANDDCSGAIGLTVNPDNSCTATTTGTIQNASNSGLSSCSGNPNDDVWYTFVATNTAHTIDLLNVTGSTTDLYHAVYANNPCTGTTTALTCSDPNSSTTYGLTIGTTYYVQVYSWSSSTGATTSFDICIGTPPPCTTPNTPAAPITFDTITASTIAGSFPASVPAANNYLVIRSLTATPPALTNGTTYTNGQTFGAYTVVDTDNNTNFTATALTQTTTYYFFVFAYNNNDCSGGPMYSNTPLNGNATTVEPSYCIPSSTSTTDYIDDFTTSGGSTNINHIGSGFSTNGYGDFTSSHNVTQLPGGTINFTATHGGTSTYQINIWVDWNNDLDFDDANEKVFDASAYVNIENGSFNVLNTAAPGSYRMRVRTDWSSSNVSPCGYDDRSETHDYTLNVTPLNCTANPQDLTAISSTTTTATISWIHPTPQPGNGYDYIVSTDNTPTTPAGDITGTTTGNTVSLTGLTPGTTYYVFVRGNCNNTDKGFWVTTFFSTSCLATVFTPTVCPTIIGVQGNDPFIADPFIADPNANISCELPSITLEAFSNLRETSTYKVEKINYPNPAPIYDFSVFSGSQTVTRDDYWADNKTDINFPFCFYNNTYTQTLVGANGMITFNSAIAPGEHSGYSFSENLPSTAGALFEQTIYGVYHDIDPTGLPGNPIKSRVEGTAPCRQFQVSWNNIPMFSDNSILYTGMIVLHETTNIIEVFIEEKRIDNNNISPWNDGNAIVGIQGVNIDNNPNNPANEYTVAPCRNGLDTNWETYNEAWRFTPNGAAINPDSITWYSANNGGIGGTILGTGNTIEVNSEDTYYAVSQYSLCSGPVTLTDDIVVTKASKTWMGYINDNWYEAGNWEPNGVPTASDCVLVPDAIVSNVDNPIIDETNAVGSQPAFALNLTVAPTGTIDILANSDLEVTDWIRLDGTINMKDTASLIQITETNMNSGTGTLKMQRTVPGGVGPQHYVYWSSPVDNFNVADINTAASELRWEWNPTVDGVHNGTWIPATGTMTIGKGYIIRGLATPPSPIPPQTAEFVGQPNNGIINPPISRGTYTGAPYTAVGGGSTQATKVDDNWNLVGNPYPSAISGNAFIAENATGATPKLDGTIYLWSHLGLPIGNTTDDPFYGNYVYNYLADNYVAYNGTGSNPPTFFGNIAAGQSFFVQMEDILNTTNTTVTFNNAMRVGASGNDNFLRTTETERHRIWIDLVNSNNSASSILVGYIAGATNEKDRLFDGYNLSETAMQFYSLIADEKMVIQGKALPFDNSDTVPLGMVIPQAGNYTIAINTIDGLFESTNQDIYLEDTYTGIIHDLRGVPYSFNSSKGTFDDRFILRYTNQTLSQPDEQMLNGLLISAPNNQYIKVSSGFETIKSVSVYDVLGRNLFSKKNINENVLVLNNVSFSNGTYIVKVTLSNGLQKTQKVVLNL